MFYLFMTYQTYCIMNTEQTSENIFTLSYAPRGVSLVVFNAMNVQYLQGVIGGFL